MHPSEVPRYLTNIISSSLSWLSPEDAEAVWDGASARLSERSGRTAAPALDRSFRISDSLVIRLHEPSLTEDKLGLKTWTSSLLLARRLPLLAKHIPHGRPQVLELGSGTGLVGLAAASTWKDSISGVLLTDLPEIVPNLRRNIEANAQLSQNSTVLASISVNCRVLDWADEKDRPENDDGKYPLIMAADPIYTSDHPAMLTRTVKRWLEISDKSRFIVELPLRDGYTKDRADLRQRLQNFMQIEEEGEDRGYDDWEGSDGRPAEVTCWWAVWKLRECSET